MRGSAVYKAVHNNTWRQGSAAVGTVISSRAAAATSVPRALKESVPPLAIGISGRQGTLASGWRRQTMASATGAPAAADPAVAGVATALQKVYAKVRAAEEKAGGAKGTVDDDQACGVTLVAVSKTKPVPLLREAYDAGHRHFGENYVNEIVEKAPMLPPDVRWHFIGHLQSNKAKLLVKNVPNLAVVETVDSKKIATYLNRACVAAQSPGDCDSDGEGGGGSSSDEASRAVGVGHAADIGGERTLDVLIQVNTSGEESKHGIEPDDESLLDLARHITETCGNLRLRGVMTIGMPDYTSRPENFECLTRCRWVCRLHPPRDDRLTVCQWCVCFSPLLKPDRQQSDNTRFALPL